MSDVVSDVTRGHLDIASDDAAGTLWADLLEPGETVLWEGRPEPTLRFVPRNGSFFGSVLTLVFALPFVSLSTFTLMTQPFTDGGLTSLLLFAIGAFFLFIGFVHPYIVQYRTSYLLTDRRGLIASSLYGRRRFESYTITADNHLELEEGDPGSVVFAKYVGTGAENEPVIKDVAFENIPEARKVFMLIRRIQEDRA